MTSERVDRSRACGVRDLGVTGFRCHLLDTEIGNCVFWVNYINLDGSNLGLNGLCISVYTVESGASRNTIFREGYGRWKNSRDEKHSRLYELRAFFSTGAWVLIFIKV
jgi:hypothetical protein